MMGDKNKKQLVYVSHPFGNKEENLKEVNEIMYKLCTCKKLAEKYVFVSPVNCYGTFYDRTDYQQGLDICIGLLSQCDIMLLCGDWQSSKGCVGEREHCIKNSIHFITAKDMNAIDRKVSSGSLYS